MLTPLAANMISQTRDGSNDVLTQHPAPPKGYAVACPASPRLRGACPASPTGYAGPGVWGTQYVDELVQVGHNDGVTRRLVKGMGR